MIKTTAKIKSKRFPIAHTRPARDAKKLRVPIVLMEGPEGVVQWFNGLLSETEAELARLTNFHNVGVVYIDLILPDISELNPDEMFTLEVDPVMLQIFKPAHAISEP